MHITSISKQNKKDYEDFINNMKDTLFYHQLRYRDMLIDLLDCEDNYRIIYENNKICGVLPILSKNGEFGDVINSLPYFGSNGGIIAEKDKHKSILLEEYNKIAERAFKSDLAIPMGNM